MSLKLVFLQYKIVVQISVQMQCILFEKQFIIKRVFKVHTVYWLGARCSSVVRAFAHGAMGRRIDPSWGGPIELFLVPASALRLV